MTSVAGPAWRIRGDACPENVRPTPRDGPNRIIGIDLYLPLLPWPEVSLICGIIAASYINAFLLASG